MLKRKRPVVVSPLRISWQSYELPHKPAAGMVRLTALRSLISPGTELALYEGRAMPDGLNSGFSPTASSLALDSSQVDEGRRFPVALGYNMVGVVSDVGEGVSERRIGSHAFALCRHQPIADVADWEAIPLPTGAGVDVSALYYIPSLGLSTLRRLAYQSGMAVAIVGLGLVGLCAALVARSSGARIIAFESSDNRRKFASQFLDGSNIFDPNNRGDVTEALEQTHRHGCDLIIESAGTESALRLAAEIGIERCKIGILGLHSEDLGQLFSRNFYSKKLELLFCGNDPYKPPDEFQFTVYNNVREIAIMQSDGRLSLEKLITLTGGAYHIDEGLRQLAARSGTEVVVLDWESPEAALARLQ